MKKKTISVLGTSLGLVALLASCSGKQINRSDALTLLTTMSDTVGANSYVLPTQWGVAKSTASTLKEARSYNEGTYFYGGMVGSTTASSVTTKYSQEGWAYIADTTLTLAFRDGTTKTMAKTSTSGTGLNDVAGMAAFSAIMTVARSQSAKIQTTPNSLKDYLKGFKDGTGSSAVYAGTAANVNCYMKSESYVYSGTGNLNADFTTVYADGEEHLLYRFRDSKIWYVQNDKSQTATTYTWGNYSEAAFTPSGYADVSSNAGAIATLGVSIASLASVL